MRRALFSVSLVLAFTLGGCGYNTLQSTDEQIKAGWA
ncbi:MAG: LemA family protein, partial [Nitrospirae bacterium]|nr:LemA family protein [Nitrospirota bacterium]